MTELEKDKGVLSLPEVPGKFEPAVMRNTPELGLLAAPSLLVILALMAVTRFVIVAESVAPIWA